MKESLTFDSLIENTRVDQRAPSYGSRVQPLVYFSCSFQNVDRRLLILQPGRPKPTNHPSSREPWAKPFPNCHLPMKSKKRTLSSRECMFDACFKHIDESLVSVAGKSGSGKSTVRSYRERIRSQAHSSALSSSTQLPERTS
jgi:hypothetical protein